MNITIEGRFVSFEYQKLDEENAKRILESGLTEDEQDEMSFEDGGDWGVIEGAWEVGGTTVSFEFKSLPGIINQNTHEGWLLVNEEAGRVTYSPHDVADSYDVDLLTFSKHSDVFNGYSIDYAIPMYGDEEFELDWQDVKVCSLTLISPDGTCYTVETDE